MVSTDLHALNVEAARALGLRLLTKEEFDNDPFGGDVGTWYAGEHFVPFVMVNGGPFSPTTDANDALRLQTAVIATTNCGEVEHRYYIDTSSGKPIERHYVTIAEWNRNPSFGRQGIAKASAESYPEALTRALLAVAGRDGG